MNWLKKVEDKFSALSQREKILFLILVLLLTTFLSLSLVLIKNQPAETGLAGGTQLSQKNPSAPPREGAFSPVTKLIKNIAKTLHIIKEEPVSTTPAPDGIGAGISGKPASLSPAKGFSTKEIATKALDFIDKQKNPDGFYNFYANGEDLCLKKGNPLPCPPDGNNVIEGTNMWTILARVSFYNNFSHDEKDLNKAEIDAKTLMQFCRSDYNKCLPGSVVPIINLYNQTKNPAYKDFLFNLGKTLLTDNTGIDTMDFATEARELARLSEIFPDQNYLETALKRIEKAETLSKEPAKLDPLSTKMGIDVNSCYLVLAQSEIGRITNNQQYIQKAVDFMDSGEIQKIPPELTVIQPCIEGYFNLAEYLNDNQIREKAEALLSFYVINYWDGPGLDKFYHQGGFIKNLDPQWVNITDTGYMIYLLGLAPEKSYEIKQANQ